MEKYQVGQLVIGTVKNVKPYALFLSFENGSEGLLHISEISDGYIRDIEKYGSIGDQIKVKILTIDEKNGFLRVSYKQVPQEESFSTHKNQDKVILNNSEEEFKILKDHLEDWIQIAVEKEKK